jgi:hypothetical protein
MKPQSILAAALALALGARAAPAQVSYAPDLPALATPAVAPFVPVMPIYGAPYPLAGPHFGIAAGYRSAAFIGPRYGYGAGPGLYGVRWGSPFMYRPYYRHWANGAVIYQPRVQPSPPPAPRTESKAPSSQMSIPIQLHGGFFAHQENGPRSYAAGLRGGPAIDKHLQIGLGVDWYHRTDSDRAIVSDTVQAGQAVKVTRVLSQASTDLIPLEAFLQLSLGRGVVPYAGIAGEYQFLLLNATDNVTGAGYNATFGGLGWQAWGGLGVDFGRSRLFGEVFVNAGNVERDVHDPSGTTYRETINADGGGARFGLSWGF